MCKDQYNPTIAVLPPPDSLFTKTNASVQNSPQQNPTAGGFCRRVFVCLVRGSVVGGGGFVVKAGGVAGQAAVLPRLMKHQ